MHVTSNPFFAYHDDVFPGFAKNIFNQAEFNRSASSISLPFPRTIVPDNEFFALEEFAHFSTIELKLNGTERFEIELKIEEMTKDEKILDLKFFNEKSFFNMISSSKSGIKIQSDFMMDSVSVELKSSKLTKFEFILTSNISSVSSTIEIFKVKPSLHIFSRLFFK